MRKTCIALLGAVATMSAAPALAADPIDSFGPGASSPSPGFSVVFDFDTTVPAGILGPLVQIKTPPADGNGAPPANSDGSSYLSVLGGGSATINFANAADAVQFDWGSIDRYNTLRVLFNDSTFAEYIPGSSSFPNDADGNQVADGTNGLFTVRTSDARRIIGVSLSSSSNSFEIDNLALAGVPEPATWALMILGFGAVGGAMRRRKAHGTLATA